MKLHMKLWYFKSKKVTEPDYEKISFWVKSLKKNFFFGNAKKISPLICAFLGFHDES